MPVNDVFIGIMRWVLFVYRNGFLQKRAVGLVFGLITQCRQCFCILMDVISVLVAVSQGGSVALAFSPHTKKTLIHHLQLSHNYRHC